MTEKNLISTGNEIVDAIGKINITGNVIPEAWYSTIQKKLDHPYFHAIILLSEILYWYRPSEICDETTGKRSYKKKFQSDLWQISMGALSEKFELSKDQVREALDFLETETKVIIRHYRSIRTRTGIVPNVLYIELVPAVLMELTYPTSDDSEIIQTGTCDFSNTYSENIDEVLEKTPIPTGENSNTNTKNTTENNRENTIQTATTEETVVCCCDNSLISYVKEKFIRYDLNDKDAVLIVNTATKGTEDIDRAYEYLINYNKTINNIVPFIVSTIKNGWEVQKVEPSNKRSDKDIHGFSSRQYDWDALEKELVNRGLNIHN